jgi:hypothetical protein
VISTFGVMFTPDQERAASELLRLSAKFNRSGDATVVVPSEYLEVVVIR